MDNNLVKAYEQYLFQEELAEGTIEIYVRQMHKLLHYFEQHQTNITKAEMIEYKRELMQENCSVSTINLQICAMNRYLCYAGYEECRAKSLRVQKKTSLENVISLEEYHEILNYAKESGRIKYYYILKTLAFTGIRISELKFFTVESLKKEKIVIYNKGKIREVYLPKKLSDALWEYCADQGIENGVIFRGNKDSPITRIAVYKMLKKLADMVGVPKEKVYPHSIRHMFAKTYMDRYADISELADILGHSSLETTRIYTSTTTEEKRERMNALDM